MSSLRTALLCAAVAAALGLPGCGGDDEPAAAGDAPAGATATPTPDRPALAY